jgi:ABC-type multidrug transport system fused ATPase/permease subunit
MAHPLLRCFAFYRLHPWMTLAVTSAIAVINASGPLSQYLFGRALHDVETGNAFARLADGTLDGQRAWFWAEVLIGLWLVRGVAQYFSTVLSIALGQRLLNSLRSLIFRRVQELDVAYHQRHGAGEIINRATRDSDKVRDAVVGGYRSLVELVIILLSSLGMICWYDWRLAAVPLALVLTAVVIGAAQSDRLVALNRGADEAYDHVAQELSEGVHGVRVIKAFALEKRRIARFVERVGGFAAASRSAVAFTAQRLPLPQLVVALGHPWVLGFGAWLVAHDALNRGELIAATMAMQSMVFRVESISRLVQTFADARASAQRVIELIDAKPAILDGSAPLPQPPLTLQVENVAVKGPEKEAILDGVELVLNPGELVALVGATGSGKSTLASLLPRLRDPDGGRVLLGGVDLRTLRLRELRCAVQVVYQDSFLFSDSLAGNLRMAAPQATDEDLLTALKAAAAEDVLTSLPDGLASRIGERGVTLSGGQRQRVCIARALLAKPAVLCLDDATSALDALTERRVLDGLRARRDCAVLMIASKLSTIRQADRVLLLERGRIAAAGSHESLIALSREYRDLLGLEPEEAA